MIAAVFKKELLSHLLSQRFAICTILAVLLMSANGLLSSQNWSLKKASYQANKAVEAIKPHDITYYSALAWDRSVSILVPGLKEKVAPRALRVPRPLELFAQGDEQQLGQAVRVLLFEIPHHVEEVDTFSSDNPYLAIFGTYDIVYVFQLVLGLLAILMASESISGEKEDGTLRLTLTTNISRAQVLAGKVLGGVTTLAIPTALGFILLMIMLLGTEGMDASAADLAGDGHPLRALAAVFDGALLDRAGCLVLHGPLGHQLDLCALFVGTAHHWYCPTASRPCSTSRST